MRAKPHIALAVLENAPDVLLRQSLIRPIEHEREIARLIGLVHCVEVVLSRLVRYRRLHLECLVNATILLAPFKKLDDFLAELGLVFLDAPTHGVQVTYHKFGFELRILGQRIDIEVDYTIVGLATYDFWEKFVSLLVMVVDAIAEVVFNEFFFVD